MQPPEIRFRSITAVQTLVIIQRLLHNSCIMPPFNRGLQMCIFRAFIANCITLQLQFASIIEQGIICSF